MKKLIIILIFAFIPINIVAQNYKVLYEVKAKLGKTRELIQEDFLLCINNHKSIFVSNEKVISDTIMRKKIAKTMKGNREVVSFDMKSIKVAYPKIKLVIEKQFINNQLRYQNTGFMSTLQYTQKLPVLQWKIKDSTKTILGYKAQKATLHYKGRNYIAWYATEIAIPEGPYKFWGLPGLILEIYDSKNEYSFKIKGIEKSDFYPKNVFHEKLILTSLIKTTEKDYLKTLYKTYNANAVMGTTAVIGEDADEYARERVEKLKASRNNPIELE